MDPIIEALNLEIACCDLENFSPPYLPKTFTKWRTHLWSHHSENPLKFIKTVDSLLNTNFIRKVTKRYYHDTISENSRLQVGDHQIDTEEYKEELIELSSVLARWSTELELAVDIIERSKLYGIYQVPKGLEDVYTEISSEWDKQEESFEQRLYRFLLFLLEKGTDKLTVMMQTSISGLMTANVVQAKGAVITSAMYAYYCGFFPWPILALMGTELSWMLLSWIVTRVGGQISHNLDHSSVSIYISELKHHIELLLSDLMHRNTVSLSLIEKCFENENSEKEEAVKNLFEHLNEVLLHKADTSLSTNKQYDEDEFVAQIAEIEVGEDWIDVSLPDFTLQNLKGSWMGMEENNEEILMSKKSVHHLPSEIKITEIQQSVNTNKFFPSSKKTLEEKVVKGNLGRARSVSNLKPLIKVENESIARLAPIGGFETDIFPSKSQSNFSEINLENFASSRLRKKDPKKPSILKEALDEEMLKEFQKIPEKEDLTDEQFAIVSRIFDDLITKHEKYKIPLRKIKSCYDLRFTYMKKGFLESLEQIKVKFEENENELDETKKQMALILSEFKQTVSLLDKAKRSILLYEESEINLTTVLDVLKARGIITENLKPCKKNRRDLKRDDRVAIRNLQEKFKITDVPFTINKKKEERNNSRPRSVSKKTIISRSLDGRTIKIKHWKKT